MFYTCTTILTNTRRGSSNNRESDPMFPSLPMGVAYDLLPSTGNVWKSTAVTELEFDIPDGVAEPLLLQITFRGQSECHSPGLFSEVVIEF